MAVVVATTRAVSADSPDSSDDHRYVHGMTISCFRDGPGEWDSPGMSSHLAYLKKMGVNWVAIHPYARIGNDGAVHGRMDAEDSSVIMPTLWCHDRDVCMMVKPHIAYWGSRFRWRGEIRFDTDEQWQRFFDSYEAWIVQQARLAALCGAQAFCVGTELDGTTGHEARWRQIIAKVRAVYGGHLTYAANWDTYREVPFWDALDVIGIQAYFPLTQQAPPTEADLVAGWSKVFAEVEAFGRQRGKPVVFTELGYTASEHAAQRPWEDQRVGDTGDAVKLLCLRVALQQVDQAYQRGTIRGAFLWKWFVTDRMINREFTLNYPAAEAVIKEVWADQRLTYSN